MTSVIVERNDGVSKGLKAGALGLVATTVTGDGTPRCR